MKDRNQPANEPAWKSQPGEPPIKGPGDLLAMMVQSGAEQSAAKDAKTPPDERAAEGLPPRKAIISVHGKDVEEREIPRRRRRRAA